MKTIMEIFINSSQSNSTYFVPARDSLKHLMHITHLSSQQPCEVNTIIFPIVQMRELKNRKVK